MAVEICRTLGDYCLIGGLAANCYVEPVYTLDADFVIVSEKIPELERRLRADGFTLEMFSHSLNAQAPDSDLGVQFTTDLRYQAFLARAVETQVLGQQVRVAALEDVVQGKLWPYPDSSRRLGKRKKDELDLLRLAEAYPQLWNLYPAELKRRLQ